IIPLTRSLFHSRRRHTIFSRDWSSDVCSSDLEAPSSGRSASIVPETSLPVWSQALYSKSSAISTPPWPPQQPSPGNRVTKAGTSSSRRGEHFSENARTFESSLAFFGKRLRNPHERRRSSYSSLEISPR